VYLSYIIQTFVIHLTLIIETRVSGVCSEVFDDILDGVGDILNI
jgi:hypothetical protein